MIRHNFEKKIEQWKIDCYISNQETQILKKTKNWYFKKLDAKKVTNNKSIWRVVKLCFLVSPLGMVKITLTKIKRQ